MLLSVSGRSTAEIGRVVMLYYLMLVVLGPLANAAIGKEKNMVRILFLGTITSATALYFHDLSAGVVGYTLSIVGLGIGHSLIRTPLLTAVIRAAGDATGPVNILRGVERLGGLVGLAAGSVLFLWGWADLALTGLAWISITGGVLLYLHHAIVGTQYDYRTQAE